MEGQKRHFPITWTDRGQPLPVDEWRKHANKQVETYPKYRYTILAEDFYPEVMSIDIRVTDVVENIFIGLAESSEKKTNLWEIAIAETEKRYRKFLVAIRPRIQGKDVLQNWINSPMPPNYFTLRITMRKDTIKLEISYKDEFEDSLILFTAHCPEFKKENFKCLKCATRGKSGKFELLDIKYHPPVKEMVVGGASRYPHLHGEYTLVGYRNSHPYYKSKSDKGKYKYLQVDSDSKRWMVHHENDRVNEYFWSPPIGSLCPSHVKEWFVHVDGENKRVRPRFFIISKAKYNNEIIRVSYNAGTPRSDGGISITQLLPEENEKSSSCCVIL